MGLSSLRSGTRYAPISLYQEAVIATASDPQTTQFHNEHNTIRWAFRVMPGLAPRRVARAFDKLTARHESLRLSFVQRAKGWVAEISPKHAKGLLVEDYSALTPTEQDDALRVWANTPLAILTEPMFEMVLMRCGAGGDVLLIRAHHGVVDGYGLLVMFEELLKLVLNLPVFGTPPGQADFVLSERQRLAADAGRKAAYWQDQLLPLPPDPMIGRTLAGLAPITAQTSGPTIRLDAILTAAQIRQVEGMASKAGISSFCFLFAAFAETICNMGHVSEVMVNSVLARHDGAMAGFVGSDIQRFIVKYAGGLGDIANRAAWVSGQVADAAGHLPATAFFSEGAITKAFAQQNVSPRRFIVHIGHPTGRMASSPFKALFDTALEGRVSLGHLSMERISLPGRNETDYELNLLIGTTKERLNGSIIASADGYGMDDLKAIAAGIRRHLSLAAV